MHDVDCPYCGAGVEIVHDDGYGYEEGKKYQEWCGACKKYFAYTTSISFYYEATKADCLNDDGYDWLPTTTFPKCHTDIECTMCGERRKPTEAEKIQYKIPTWDEEMKTNKESV